MAYNKITPEQYEAGLAVGRAQLAKASLAEGVRYNGADDAVIIEMPKATIAIPRSEIREFSHFTQAEMTELRLSALGDALAVGSFDVHVDIGGLLADLLPLGTVFARRGGATKSDAKARAAKENGKLGGRPRKAAAAE
ncbi:hypothetical protein [Azospirillum sp. SYSU D00513]|uniref:hypothetical protein n=1 Tax=Azospirillum sp. SYSU D00513 TaxID=2812561 RepID=UPI001A9578A1|nr:hypothetical protein [Azospirillum sp. SYSU D00513]